MQHDAAYYMGVIAGRTIAIVLPLIFIVSAANSLRRPRANAKCFWSLILLLSGFALAEVAYMLVAAAALPAIATAAATFLLLVLTIASAVLAIIGLAEYRRRRSRHGRATAIVALCLTALFLAMVAAGVINARNGALLRAAGLQKPGPPFVSVPLNFRFAVQAPWVQISPASLNSESVLSLVRGNPPMYFTVIAEKPGVESPMTTRTIVEVVKAHVQSVASTVNFLRETPARIHDIDGVQLDFDAEMMGQHISYVQWVSMYHGIAYELTAWAPAAFRPALDGEAAGLFDKFQLIDPNQEAHTPGFSSAKDYHSLTNGFTVKLASSAWNKPVPKLFEIAPHAEFGVQDANGDTVLILPLPLDGHDPDLETLTTAFLSRFNTQYPGDAILSQKRVTHGPLEGNGLTFSRTISGIEHRSQAQVLKGHGFACLLIATAANTDSSADARLEDALGRVEFDNPPATLDTKLLTTRERQARADLLNEIGIALYHGKRFDDAFGYFKDARSLVKENAFYSANATDALIGTGHYREALDDLRGFLGTDIPAAPLRARLAYLQSQTGAVDDALKNFDSLFAGGFRDDTYFSLYINLLSQSRQHDTAIAEINAYLNQNDSVPIRILLANVYRQAGKTDKALETLRGQLEIYPEDRQLSLALAQTYLGAGRYAEAVDVCAKLCENGQGTALAYYLKGSAEYGLKHYREAKASLDEAINLDPSSADARRFRDHVSGMLGEGANAALQTPIDPVAIPASLLAPPSGAKEPSGIGGYYKTFVKAIEFIPGKEFKTTETRAIKVLDESGVTAFSSFEVPFDPLSEEIFVNSLIVKGADGAVLSTGSASDYYVMDDTSRGEATQRKVVHIPVSGVRPGCEISLTYTLRDIGGEDAFRFSTHTFSKAFPILRSALFVRAPRNSVKAEIHGGITQSKLEDGICWTIDQPAVYRWEPLQPEVEAFLPTVWLGDPAAAWKTIGQDYLDSIRDRLPADDDIRKTAAETVGNLKTLEDKIGALARFAQKDFTYTAIEFGRRARIPNKASTTLQNRYGDCKDHAVLLRALLDAAGVPAQLALVNVKGDLREDMPSLDQFDHMIVYVPSLRGGSFIDCTNKDSDVDAAVPLGLAKKKALILDDTAPHLAAIPDYAPESNSVAATRTVEILHGADASVREDVKLQGPSAAFFRSLLRHVDPGNRQAMLQQEMASSAPALEVREVKFDNLDDPQAPLDIQVAYLVKGQFRRVGDEVIGQLPAVWERLFLGSEAVESRETPFAVSFPVSFQSSVALSVPAGYMAEAIPAAEVSNSFAACTSTTRQKTAAIEINCSIQEASGQFAPSQYASYHDTLSRALGAIEPNVVLKAVPK